MSRQPRKRRGIVLLVVVSLLVLFVLAGLTYAIVASQYRMAAETASRREQLGDDPRKQLDTVLYDLLRDTKYRTPLQSHSLLGDLYGNDGVTGRVNTQDATQPIRVTGGRQFIEFHFRPAQFAASLPLTSKPFVGTPPFGRPFKQHDHYYSGCVLTMLDGRYAGRSTRVVDYFFNPGRDGIWGPGPISDPDNAGLGGADDVIFVRVEWFDSDGSLDPTLPQLVQALDGFRFLINGHSFNGTGFGYDVRGAFTAAGAPRNLDLASVEPGPNGMLETNLTTTPIVAAGDDVVVPVALLPHFSGFAIPPLRPADEGGADESWDVADYQNMALAFVPTNPLDTTAMVSGLIPSFHRPDLVNYWWNDPGRQPLSTAKPLGVAGIPDYREFRRRYIMRPMPWDHPSFTGSNSNFTPRDIDGNGSLWVDINADGTPDQLESDDELMNKLIIGMGGSNGLPGDPMPMWDVDNDGDGIPDSIWIDLGLPVRTSADGRSYRPLVAILVKDLDGRLNLNAHGNRTQMLPLFMGLATGPLQPVPDIAADGRFAGGAPRQVLGLPRGLGYGPAEIFFGHALNPANANVEYLRLMEGRYGVDANVALLGVNEPLTSLQALGLTHDFGLTISAHSSRPDIHGVGSIGIDYYGQPEGFYMADTTKVPSQILDDPYEADLSVKSRGVSGADVPYTHLELEHLLRWADSDSAGISERVYQRAPMSFAPGAGTTWTQAWQRRELFTTDSWHIPHPNFAVPRERIGGSWMRDALIRWLPGPDLGWGKVGVDDDGDGTPDNLSEAGWPHSDDVPNLPGGIVELLSVKLAAGGLNSAQINAEVAKMLPVEVLQGRPLDLNRMWGNGFDDNNNFVVDEPFEGDGADNDSDGTPDNERFEPNGRDDNANGQVDELAELATGEVELLKQGTGTYFDNRATNENNGAPAPIGRMGRQIFARNLYCLLMLLKGEDDRDLDGAPGNDDDETATLLAQFAVNVVDFRDADAIYTPFEFDLNPFDGWQVDGLVETNEGIVDRAVVWGCERPELLISETLAFHARRTEDLSVGGQVGDTTPDEDYDQRLRPRGSFFVELFNPWWNNGAQGFHKLPAELYEAGGGVQLNRFVPGPGGPSPVWRMLIVKEPSPVVETDLDDPMNSAVVAERSVYFTDPTWVSINDPRDGTAYWTTLPVAPLEPGRYAVVGSSGQPMDLNSDGSIEYTTVVGRTTAAVEGDAVSMQYTDTRRIVLEPNVDEEISQVRVLGNQTPTLTSMPAAPTNFPGQPPDIRPVVAVPIGQPRSVSITEPESGYPLADFDLALAPPEGAYLNPMDQPLDATSPDALILQSNGTHAAFRNVHLQRLANPLLPWNPEPPSAAHNPNLPVNIYLTVDSMTVDLTTFNGVTSDSDDPLAAAGTTDFASKERGSKTSSTDGNSNPTLRGAPYTWRNLWAHEPPNLAADIATDPAFAEPGPVTHYFPHVLKETLGYLNHDFHPFFTSTPPPGIDPLNYRGAPDTISVPLGGVPAGWTAPLPTFPWLSFHDRPFANPLELLQVPMIRSSQLGKSFSSAHQKTGPGLPATNPQEQFRGNAPTLFPHLLDFFHAPTPGEPPAEASVRAFRLFDYVETPSRFAGTRNWLDPNDFSTGIFGAGLDGGWGMAGVDDDRNGTIDDVTEAGWPGSDDPGNETRWLWPPFCWTSRYREPGRININSFSDPYVWFGLAKGFPAMDTFSVAREVMMSRRGSGGTSPLALNASYPTFFANPFRSAASADLMPDVGQMRKDGSTSQQLEVHATLLRGSETSATVPLFRFESIDAGTGFETQHDNSDRNTHFRYLGLQRLSNLVSTHSNVFGVWITMGYFEVEPNTNAAGVVVVDTAHPDGYRLGQERGTDTGDIVRHRSFYIIDRSIPVAFEPGENHNVDRAVVLRRHIE